MRRPTAIRLLMIVIGLVLLFAAFGVSVAVLGPWWRYPNMPTAEEWSAFFGASALIALGFAWYQIRQVDNSNKALVASNDHTRRVNLETIKPRVQVWLDVTRTVGQRRGGAVEGNLFIAIRNVGPSSAQDVRLTVDTPFASLPEFFDEGKMEAHFEEVNKVFSGDVAFSTLIPGQTYIWYLGRVPDIFAEREGVPRKWVVTAHYGGAGEPEPFVDEMTLDLDLEKRLEVPVDSLVRIGRDIEVVGSKLEAIRAKMKS